MISKNRRKGQRTTNLLVFLDLLQRNLWLVTHLLLDLKKNSTFVAKKKCNDDRETCHVVQISKGMILGEPWTKHFTKSLTSRFRNIKTTLNILNLCLYISGSALLKKKHPACLSSRLRGVLSSKHWRHRTHSEHRYCRIQWISNINAGGPSAHPTSSSTLTQVDTSHPIFWEHSNWKLKLLAFQTSHRARLHGFLFCSSAFTSWSIRISEG